MLMMKQVDIEFVHDSDSGRECSWWEIFLGKKSFLFLTEPCYSMNI